MKLCEASIQDLLYEWCEKKKHRLTMPNSSLMGGCVSDLVSVDYKGRCVEFEIKLSRSDYRADFKKHRHFYLQQRERFERKPSGAEQWQEWVTGAGRLLCPSFFYFVTPPDLITVAELPPYAGLLYATPALDRHTYLCDWIAVIRRAPLIHSIPLPDGQRRQLERAAVARYWKLRLSLHKEKKDEPDSPTAPKAALAPVDGQAVEATRPL